MSSSARYRFDDLTLDTGRCQLSRGTQTIALSKLSYRMLCALVEASPNVLSHDELADAVWDSRRIVTPENLAKRVMILRRALGDCAGAPRYVEGVRGIGYRLVPEARLAAQEPASPGVRRADTRRAIRYVLAALIITAAGVAAAATSWIRSMGNDEYAMPAVTALPAPERSPEVRGVRINVQLVDAESERMIWVYSYEGELGSDEMTGIQTDIVCSVIEGLHGTKATDEVVPGCPGYLAPM